MWIARNTFHHRTIALDCRNIWNDTSHARKKRKPNVSTRGENVASALMRLTRRVRVPTLCRFESRKGSAPS